MLLLSPSLLAQSKLKRIFSFVFNVQSFQDPKNGEVFYVEDFGLFKALIPLGKDTKCIALNSKNELSLERFDKYSPPPHTIFLITKAN